MKQILLSFSILFLISGCSPKKFIISSMSEDPVSITIMYNKEGEVSIDKDFEYQTNASPPIVISGKSENFNGSITYSKSEDTEYSLQAKQNNNIYEIEKEIISNKGKAIEVYHLKLGEPEIITNNSFGYLKLTSNENNVDVYLDNELIGEISSVSFNKKVPAGSHILMVRKDFFIPISIKVNILEKEIYPYNFELKSAKGWIEEQPDQASTMQARGNLTIATEKSDYKVKIEGVEKEVPFQIKDMPAGIYKIKVICPDFEKDMELIVNENQTTFIDLDEKYER